MQPQPDHLDSLLSKETKQAAAFLHRLLQLHRVVKPLAVEIFQFGAPDGDGRIDAHRFRREGRNLPHGVPVVLDGAFIKAGHHLQPQLKAGLSDSIHRLDNVLRGVAAAVCPQHPVAHALHAELDGGNAVLLQKAQDFPVHRIRPGGDTDACKAAFSQKGLRGFEQRNHIPPLDGGEAAAEEGELGVPQLACAQAYRLLTGCPHCLRSGGCLLAGDAALIAEAALMRAADVRDKDRDVGVSHYLPISSSASLAAICSAFFLLLPSPLPMTLELSITSTRKRLSWSGPFSPTSL